MLLFFKKEVFLSCLLLAAAAPDPVVAIRGNDELTVAQVRALLDSQMPEQRKKLESDPAAMRGLIRDTLLQHALLAEAAAQKWDSKPDVAALLARVREGAIVESFLAAQSQVPAGYPTEADVQSAYEHARPQLTRPRGYHLSQVFVAVPADAPAGGAEAARRTLASFARDVAAGRASFDAPKHAAGATYADLGWIAETQLQKGAHDAVAGLLEGQITPPVCTANGCTLIKLLATRAAGPPPLAEVHEQLVRLLRQQKQKALAQAYANSLLAKSPVRVNEIELSHVTSP